MPLDTSHIGKFYGVWIPLKLFPHSPAPSMRAMVRWQQIVKIEAVRIDRFLLHFELGGMQYVNGSRLFDIAQASHEYKRLRQ